MKILVTGDRRWNDRTFLWATLSELGATEIIEGCARGADEIAEEWCRMSGTINRHFPADWSLHGKAAGPIRNRRMILLHPDLVAAFHRDLANSKGTADMIRVAKQHDVPVRIFA